MGGFGGSGSQMPCIMSSDSASCSLLFGLSHLLFSVLIIRDGWCESWGGMFRRNIRW